MPSYIPGKQISRPQVYTLEGWKGDGILFSSSDPEELLFAKELGIPAVNMASGLEEAHGIPQIRTDNYTAGRMAAEHLLERALPHLAFIGTEGVYFSTRRGDGFRDRAANAGVDCHFRMEPRNDGETSNWQNRIQNLANWLRSLPLPCGIFAVEDSTALPLFDACAEAGLRIPEDIAIVGMDNNELICEQSVPKLTSIARNAESFGYEAAALLHRLMDGKQSPDREILVPPRGVVSRESSNTTYYPDPMVNHAIEYMRLNLGACYNIEAIAEHVGVSKRTLERAFKSATNSSPNQFLKRLRLQYARTLMERNPDASCIDIASECGFGSTSGFYCAFREQYGLAPSNYLKSLRE